MTILTNSQQAVLQKLPTEFIQWFEQRFRPVDHSDDYFWTWVWRWNDGFMNFWKEMDSRSKEIWVEVLKNSISS